MTPALNLAAIAMMTGLLIAAYYLGYDEGRDVELRRNQKRQAHRHRQRMNREKI